MRHVFLGSPPFAIPILRRLCDSSHETLALVTPPDRPRGRGRVVEPSALVQLANARGVRVEQPATTKSEEFVALLAELAPEVLVVASFGEILRTPVLQAAPHGCLNVHASLLPRHRGASPIQAAIAAGDVVTGVSVQRIVPALDEGDVLLALETPIDPHETAADLLERLAELGGEAIVRALDLLQRGDATFTPQDPAHATYARKLDKAAGTIDWGRTRAELDRHVRAMTPWPGAQTSYEVRGATRELIVLALEPCTDVDCVDAAPGSLVEAGGRFVVQAGDGPLEIVSVKPAGKPAMTGEAFMRGARLEPGTRLREKS